ncbi:MAG: putative ABC transporter permease [Oscillospiraceae bacterium]
MNVSITSFLVMAVVISFLGFMLENIWLLCTKGFIDNRNMHLPFLLGYAVMVLGMYFLFGTPESLEMQAGNISLKNMSQKYIAYFLISFVMVSICEILLGSFVEKFFGFEYWNYSCIPMHITKYTSIPTSIGFAYIITLFMDRAFPVILEKSAELSSGIIGVIAVFTVILLPIDFIVSFRKMYSEHKLNTIWKIKVFPKGIFEMLHESRPSFLRQAKKIHI